VTTPRTPGRAPERLRGHVTFANVTSLLALFIALGGTSYAVTSLPRNSVGSAQIRTNAVGPTEIAPKAVGSSEIRNSAIRGADVRDNTLTGNDIAESTLQTVPSASNADKAKQADNAAALNGVSADQLRGELADRCPASTVLTGGGCMETTAREATNWPTAAARCGGSPLGSGRRLPTLAELAAARNAVTGAGGPEWTSDVLDGSSTPTVVLTDVASGATSTDTTNNSHAYRCVVAPSNK
jgi:hypothetical protein